MTKTMKRLGTAALGVALLVPTAAGADVSGSAGASTIDPWLAGELDVTAAGSDLRVMINAGDLDDALAAVDAADLTLLTTFDRIGVAVAAGTPAQVRDAADEPGVVFVEGADRPLDLFMDTSHRATRADLARAGFQTDAGLAYDGTGVGVMVIDGGIDGTHPMFVLDGESKVKRNLEVVPLLDIFSAEADEYVIDDPDGDNNTDDVAGHGTHVAGTAAGYEVSTEDGTIVRGAAPGATLYGISVATAGSSYYGATAAQYWTLQNHADPCAGTAVADCAPIKSVNNSYGPIGGAPFNENSTTVEIQRASIAEGVTYVWAAGNEGGDGSEDVTGGSPKDPTPGVINVASYDDGDTGDRDNATSSFSSRGAADDSKTWPDLAAPGSNIESACRLEFNDCATDLVLDDQDPNYGNLSGTSMASPHIAGYVAVLLQADPALTPGELEYVLEDTAHKYVTDAPYTEIPKDYRDPSGPKSFSSYEQGHGLVDMAAALAAVLDEPVPTADNPCAGYTLVVDPEGDSALLTGLGPEVGGGAPTPDVDIVTVGAHAAAGEVAYTAIAADGTASPATDIRYVRFAIGLADLPESPNSRGDSVRSFFSAGGLSLTLDIGRELGPTGLEVSSALSKPDPADATGLDNIVVARNMPTVFDAVADVAYVDIPVSVLGADAGDAMGGVRVLWRRSFEALAFPADEAAATCPLLIADGPTADVPEGSPIVMLLGGLGALALAGAISRRRRATAA